MVQYNILENCVLSPLEQSTRAFPLEVRTRLEKAVGPLFGMSKAQMCRFATSMGVGVHPRTIPHATLTEFDLRVDDPVSAIEAATPLHDHYDEESDANTDFQGDIDFPHHVIELNDVEFIEALEDLEVAA